MRAIGAGSLDNKRPSQTVIKVLWGTLYPTNRSRTGRFPNLRDIRAVCIAMPGTNRSATDYNE